MIVCPNCKHDNPEGAANCEACYTALPATKACPNCGASIQLDATFCGQCGHNLKPAESQSPISPPPEVSPLNSEPLAASIGLPPTVLTNSDDIFARPLEPGVPPVVAAGSPPPLAPDLGVESVAAPIPVPPLVEPAPAQEPAPVQESAPVELTPAPIPPQPSSRQLFHLQTNLVLEIPPHLQVIHLGKPNDLVAPDIDVSGLPCAEVVSRVHANIRLEAENYYIEDVGSANGTYINHNLLAKGHRHLLSVGDRIGLGKGDLVTFIFQSPTV
jgi:pSer/pThr/pTyr-binding forkhead associated (FHA) protein